MLLVEYSDSIIVLSLHVLKYLSQLARGGGGDKIITIHSSYDLKESCKQSQLVYSCCSGDEMEINMQNSQ